MRTSAYSHPVAIPLFDVRRDEHVRVARAGGAMFAILAGYTVAETAQDTLFLGSNGPNQLALAYLLLAGIAMVALAANAWLVRHLGRRNALIVTLATAAIGTAIFFAIPRGATAGFVLYLWTGLIGTVVVVQFWLLAGTRFTTAEAKRLYGPIAAAGAVGTLAGAVVAWLLLSVLEIESLLLVAAAFYLVGAALLARDHESVERRLRARPMRARPPAGATRLRGHGYVSRLATLTICATAVALLADYLFKATAASQFHTEELASFIARYNGVVAACSLVFQLVGAAWLVRKIGVLGMTLLLPVLMVVGGAGSVFTAGSFVAICLTKGADSSLRYSVNRVATELLWMPVTERVRAAVREPLESVVTRLVQAITAALLVGLVALGVASAEIVAAVLLGIAVVWAVTAAGLRNRYLGQLRLSVSRRASSNQELDAKAIEAVVEALSSEDERRVVAAIHILTARGRTNLIPALVLRHDAFDVQAAALGAMMTPGRTDWIPPTRRMLKAPDPRVRMLALRALARVNDQTAIVAGLCDDDPGVVAHGVFWSLQTVPSVIVRDNLAVAGLLAETGSRGESARGQLLEAIRSDGDQRWVDVMVELALMPEDATIERLALAMEHVPDPRFIPFLISRLATRAGRAAIRAALRAIGEPALAALQAALDLPTTATRVRLHIPSTLSTFGTAKAAEVIAHQLVREQSGAVRYRLLRALARMAVEDEIIVDARLLLTELRHHLGEHSRLLALAVPIFADKDERDSAILLRGLLADKTSQALDRAFLALQALHPREAIREIERAILGPDRRARAHGVEFLDTLTRTPLYAGPDAQWIRVRLLVMCEDLDDRERLERVELGGEIPETVAAAVARLVHEHDTLLSASAGYYALELKTPELAAAVKEAASHRPLFEPLGIYYAASVRGA